MNRPEIELSIQRLLDEDLSADEFAALEAELSVNPDALQLYLRSAQLHCGLQSHFSFLESVEKLPSFSLEPARPLKTRRKVTYSLMAAAALVFIAMLGWNLWRPSAEARMAKLSFSADAEFSIAHVGEAGGEDADHVLRKETRVVLTEGRVEGVYGSGVRFVVDAPCELKAISDAKIGLENGRAWFEVPAAAKGFTVETTQLEVVDLGTAFGMIAKPSGREEVHVTEGSVKASTIHLDQNQVSLILRAGEGARFNEQGELEEIRADSRLFSSDLVDSFPIAVSGRFTDSEAYTPQSAISAQGPQFLADDGSDFHFTSMNREGVLASQPLVITFRAGDKQTGDDAGIVKTGLVTRAEKGRLGLGVGDGSGTSPHQHLIDGEVGYDELQDDETLSLRFNYDVTITRVDFAGFGQESDRQVWQVADGSPITVSGGLEALDFSDPSGRIVSGRIPRGGLQIQAGEVLMIRGENSMGVKSDAHGSQLREKKGDGLLLEFSMLVHPDSRVLKD